MMEPLFEKSRKDSTDDRSFIDGSNNVRSRLAMDTRLLRRAARVIAVLIALVLILFGFFVYLTVQLSKERDVLKDLEIQITRLESHQSTNPVAHVQKRALWWALGAALWAGNQVYSFFSLASSCKEFNQSAYNASSCIWGAISTAASFIGVGYKGAKAVKVIHDRLAQNGISVFNWKRDDMIADAEREMSAIVGFPTTLHGYMRHSHPKLVKMDLASANITYWPVWHFYNHQNTSIHVTLTAHHDDHSIMTLGFGHPPTKSANGTTIHKRETYDQEYFTKGGLDFSNCWNTDQDHQAINSDTDFAQMDADVACYYPNLDSTYGAEVQIYDKNVEGTVGTGSIAAFEADGSSNIEKMPGCPAGLPVSSSCAVASSR